MWNIPSTASVAIDAAMPDRRMIGMPTTRATSAASVDAAIAEGNTGYWVSARIAGSESAKLFLKVLRVSHAVA